jgi:hypothetical protein
LIFSQEKVTCNFFYHQADSIALSIIDNPTPLQIWSEDVDTSGKAETWNYQFMNWETETYVNVHLGMDSVSFDMGQGSMTGCNPMDRGWIDSDSAVAIAEANGGRQFRSKYGDIQINAHLSKPSAGPSTVWDIRYRYGSIIIGKVFYLIFDALTSEIYYIWETSVDSRETEYIYNFFQTYPNPFNASTTITFGRDKPGFATLKIYDTTGRVVDVLFESFCAPGNHVINWTPKTLPSGIYYCRLQTDRTVFTKKLIYIK